MNSPMSSPKKATDPPSASENPDFNLFEDVDLDVLENFLTGGALMHVESPKTASDNPQDIPIDALFQELKGIFKQGFEPFFSESDNHLKLNSLTDQLDQHLESLSDAQKEFLALTKLFANDLSVKKPDIQLAHDQQMALKNLKQETLQTLQEIKEKKRDASSSSQNCQNNLRKMDARIDELQNELNRLQNELDRLRAERSLEVDKKNVADLLLQSIEASSRQLQTSAREIYLKEKIVVASNKTAEASKIQLQNTFATLSTLSTDLP